MQKLQTLDYLVFLFYFIVVAGYGFWIYNKKKSTETSTKDFFLAEGSLTWWAIGASLIASNISAEQMIVAMSSWLNASALAGAAAIQQHLAITVQNYTRDLDTANTNAIAAQGLLPDIQLASTRFAKLADAERAGSLTGTSGSGTVVQLLTQMSGQLDALGQEVQASGKRVTALFEQGGKHLAKMRELISDRGPISTRSDAFASESLALMGVIANLQQTSVASAATAAYIVPMIGKLNHVGVATPSIEKSVEIYRDLLGATSIGEKFALPEQGVWVCFVDVPNSQIELIEPYGENSPITAFLAKNPAG
eukprot:gene34950-46955_t